MLSNILKLTPEQEAAFVALFGFVAQAVIGYLTSEQAITWQGLVAVVLGTISNYLTSKTRTNAVQDSQAKP